MGEQVAGRETDRATSNASADQVSAGAKKMPAVPATRLHPVAPLQKKSAPFSPGLFVPATNPAQPVLQAKPRDMTPGENEKRYTENLATYTEMEGKGRALFAKYEASYKAPSKDKAVVSDAFAARYTSTAKIDGQGLVEVQSTVAKYSGGKVIPVTASKRFGAWIRGKAAPVETKTPYVQEPLAKSVVPQYRNRFDMAKGIVYAESNYRNRDAEKKGENVKGAPLYNSDILVNQWNLAKNKYAEETKQVAAGMNFIVRKNVVNSQTRATVGMIHTPATLRTEVSSVGGSQDFFALLGTPNVSGAIQIINDYNLSFNKTIPWIKTHINGEIASHAELFSRGIDSITIPLVDAGPRAADAAAAAQ